MKLDFSGVEILVIGDPIMDEYIFGRVERVSPEAPVPVFIEESREYRSGGADNVVHQLRVLGCRVQRHWPNYGTGNWTVKTRYMVGSHQLLRVDSDKCVPNALPALVNIDAIVISDYAKGACTPEICQESIRSGLPVIVDPKGSNWIKYLGCAVICPNDKEIQASFLGIPGIVHKRGSLGLRLYGEPNPHSGMDNGRSFVDYPSTARHVFDVTGAGDTVTAVIAACVASKIDLPTSCKLANLAAGFVVGEVGTSVCPIEKLRELCA